MDGLLVACPQCRAWPMASGRPPSRWQNSREMIFRCPRCGRREVFSLRAEGGTFHHRPMNPAKIAGCGTDRPAEPTDRTYSGRLASLGSKGWTRNDSIARIGPARRYTREAALLSFAQFALQPALCAHSF
jgi:hypothetical protein